MDSGAWILCPHHKQGRLPCRWLVEMELPPGQVRTVLRTTVSLHTLPVPSRPSSGASELVAQSLLLKIYSQSYSSRVRAFWAGGEHRCPPHIYSTCTNIHTTNTHAHTYKHTHAYKITHKYTHTSVQFSSVASDFLQPHGLLPARLLCPWDSPGKNTGVGSHSLLQGIFTHKYTHTHTYTYTHTQELLESEEVSSKRLEGRKERKEGRGKPF